MTCEVRVEVKVELDHSTNSFFATLSKNRINSDHDKQLASFVGLSGRTVPTASKVVDVLSQCGAKS